MYSTPIENASSACAHTESLLASLRPIDYTVTAACLPALCAQIVVLMCALRLMRETQGAVHVFIVMATLFDMVLTAYSYPADFLFRQFASLRSAGFCWSLHSTRWLGLTASGFCIAVIISDRLMYYRLPVSYRAITGVKAFGISLIVAILAIGLVGSMWAFRVILVESSCVPSIDLSKIYLYDAFVSLACGIPVLWSCAVSTFLFFAVYRRRVQPLFRARRQAVTLQMESLSLLFTLSLLALVTLLPFRTFTAWELHTRVGKLQAVCPSEAVQWVAWALAFLLHMNPILKPFIVLMLFKPYREMTMKIIGSVWRCARCLPSQSQATPSAA